MAVLRTTPSGELCQEINSLILEYLELNGLEKSVKTFASECRDRSIPCPLSTVGDVKSTFSQNDGEDLLRAFDYGNLEVFTRLWNIFKEFVHVTSDDIHKLQVYIQVHFAIWPCAHNEPEAAQTAAMAKLKQYFEEQSTQLSQDPAILPLFALPYVGDPKNHPIFRDLFQQTWSQRLRTQLTATLTKYYELVQENLETNSKLVSLVKSTKSNQTEELSSTAVVVQQQIPVTIGLRCSDDRFFQLVKTYRDTRKLLRSTRESYGKLLKISSELILGLESSINGQTVTLEPVMRKCYDIFPELFTPDTAQSNGTDEPDKEYFKQLAASAQFDNILDSEVSLFFVGIAGLSPDNLDFENIKQVLKADDSCTADKLCLLQALRWLLTKTTPKCRELALISFIQADILGLQAEDSTASYRIKLFHCMMTKNPTYLKECLARLLNAFASLKSGRAYMGTNSYCVDLLVKSLQTFGSINESFICQMVVATLQKLSLRKQMRLEMIERDVIKWLVVYLQQELERTEGALDEPSKYVNAYFMEYAWALLMNLCLHEDSRPCTVAIAEDIITCVTRMLLSKPTKEVYPYVISTLYSLLRNPDVFATAKKMGIQKMFANCENTDDSEMRHHFNHVTALLQSDGIDKSSTGAGEVDYDDDDDIDPNEFEPEIEVTEAWVDSLADTYSTGDDLLLKKYLRDSKLSAVQEETLKGDSYPKAPQTKRVSGTPMNRPSTPGATPRAEKRTAGQQKLSGRSCSDLANVKRLQAGDGRHATNSEHEKITSTNRKQVVAASRQHNDKNSQLESPRARTNTVQRS